jgi:hypothetical protein
MGAFIAGPLSDAVGVRSASIVLAGAAVAAIAALYLVSPILRELRHQ